MSFDIVYERNAVHRPIGLWTPSVHALLHFLHQQNFKKVPLPLGFDQKGREILSFVEGKTWHNVLPKKAILSEIIVSAAELLRNYHDVSQKFLTTHTSHQKWMFTNRFPEEVICHNDFAPYNVCFQNNQAIGIIDFDTAHPGPRSWDIAYALYRFVPFSKKASLSLNNQILNACLFLDAYGFENRLGLVDLMITRLETLVAFLLTSAAAGHQRYLLNQQAGDHLEYFEDIAYLKLHQKTISYGLLNSSTTVE